MQDAERRIAAPDGKAGGAAPSAQEGVESKHVENAHESKPKPTG